MKSFIVKAQIKTDPKTGKKKIVGLHFSDNDVRKLTDKDFIKSSRFPVSLSKHVKTSERGQ